MNKIVVGVLSLVFFSFPLLYAYAADAVRSDALDTTGGATVTVESGDTLEISGKITGSGLLTTSGSGTLILSNPENDWTGGLKLAAGSKLRVTAEGALGTGKLTLGTGDGNPAEVTFAAQGAVFANDISYNRSGSIIRFSADTTLTGVLTIGNNDSYIRSDAGVCALIEGTVAGDNSRPFILDDSKGTIVFKGNLDGNFYLTEWQKDSSSGGVVYLCSPGSVFRSLHIVSVRCVCSNENVLADTAYVALNRYTANTGGLDLNGFDQTIKGFSVDSDATALKSDGTGAFVRSAEPAVLTLTGGGAGTEMKCNHVLQGAVSLVVDSDAAATNLFLNRVHPMSGTIAVNGGCLRLTGDEAAFTGVSALSVAASGAFVCDSAAEHPLPDGIALSLETGARFSLPEGTSLKVSSLTIDGENAGRGVYSAGSHPEIVSGSVIVEASGEKSAVWTGGAAEEQVSLADNWSVEGIDFSRENVDADFASGGDTAVIDCDVYFSALRLSATDFTFAPGGGTMMVFADKPVFSEPGGDYARTFAFAAPMFFLGRFYITMPTNATLGISGDISSAETDSDLVLDSSALGASIRLEGTTIAKNVLIRTAVVDGISKAGSFTVASNTVNTVKGALAVSDSSSQMLYLRSGSELIAEGGFQMRNGGSLGGGGRLTVTNMPFTCPSAKEVMVSGNSQYDGIPTLVFACAGNTVNLDLKGFGGIIDCRVNGAFGGDSHLKMDARWNGVSVLKLNSTTQSWSYVQIFKEQSGSGTVRIEGGPGAAIRVVGSGASAINGKKGVIEIDGELSIEKSGDGTLTLSNCTFNAAGVYRVTGGTLALEEAMLDPGSVLELSGNGVISVADGVRQKFEAVYVDGVPVPPGIYDYASAPDALKSHMAPTSGKIRVPGGMMLLVR